MEAPQNVTDTASQAVTCNDYRMVSMAPSSSQWKRGSLSECLEIINIQTHPSSNDGKTKRDGTDANEVQCWTGLENLKSVKA